MRMPHSGVRHPRRRTTALASSTVWSIAAHRRRQRQVSMLGSYRTAVLRHYALSGRHNVPDAVRTLPHGGWLDHVRRNGHHRARRTDLFFGGISRARWRQQISAEMRRATRLWREITRPGRFFRFKQQSNRTMPGKVKMEIKIAFWAFVIFAAFMAGRSLTAYFQKK